jgi:FKBP-type peptidyl-prolyl cis-trans isomerase
MKIHLVMITIALAVGAIACSPASDEETAADAPVKSEQGAESSAAVSAAGEMFEITPGLSARILRAGGGQAAQPGDNVAVHYTGWLYDEAAADKRGNKFDSSVDRGQQFQFPLGAGRVIKGWDQGVAGMQMGEVRELTIAPEMGYGDRGAGSVIPPGATLVFEVELFTAESLSQPASQ